MAAGGAISYNNLVGQTFTGYFQGCLPDRELGPRAVFVVDRHGNDILKQLFQQLRQLNYMDENVSILAISSVSSDLCSKKLQNWQKVLNPNL